MINFELFEGLKAYFFKTVPSSVIKIWQSYGGETIFVPAYKKPDIWFANKQLPFDDYYAMNQMRFFNYKLSRSKKLKRIQKELDHKKKSFQKSNQVDSTNYSDDIVSQKDSNINVHDGLSKMIEIICNDRLGKKVRVKCNEDDTVGDLKKLIAAQTGTNWQKIVLKKWYNTFKDHITLSDYEIHNGMSLELYYS
ncbi:hypothetical protein MERGE_002277 [Pneumocystis wakefieldiae]|uniref:Ubiquitin-like modifier HUB1 n=1 Tax=Pneumocystis wakefieldiae TaxID=38082 RepID=A0A899FWG7_9ASCO|nr:hypothetical protein MERGE_002277 [Pneumocystis wakefieldiae]